VVERGTDTTTAGENRVVVIMERGSVGKARAVGLLSIIVVVSVVGLSFFEPTPSVELLQNKQVNFYGYMCICTYVQYRYM